MTTLASIALKRLDNQSLTAPKRRTPREIVAALGAVQAQDYAGAKWALALRGLGLTDATIEQAFTAGEIVRTHVLRPTWHFVAPSDLRWMLALTAPRVHAISAYQYRVLELDDGVFRRSHAVMTKVLQGGMQATRTELGQALQRARIETKTPQRLGYLLMQAELDGVICSGARRGKQFTWALFDERVPPSKPLDPDESLRKLVMRYFTTRGPATPHDFAWWSGLKVTDAKRGLRDAGTDLEQTTVDGTTYWSGEGATPARRKSRTAHLLPNYDEYFIGFRDRSAIGQAVRRDASSEPGSALQAHIFLVDGQVVGGWKRTITSRSVVVELTPVVRLSAERRRAVDRAAHRLGPFLELPVETVWMA
jgi:hypothetical protein